MMGSTDDAVFVPISTAQARLFSGRNPRGDLMVTRVNVVAASERQTQAVEDELEALLRRRHGLKPDEEADFGVMNQADLLSMANQVTSIMTAFLGAIAGISLLVGGIGIMNIMLVSVTERTREIGIRKAVGARKADILAQFLMEAVVLSLLGGLLGILLGVGLAKIVDLTGLMNSVVTLNSVLMAVGFSVAVGLFFGIYPANQAARLNPIEALRYE
jgi:putative ABC transport system permease protein